MYAPLIGGVDALSEPVTGPCERNGVSRRGQRPRRRATRFLRGKPAAEQLGRVTIRGREDIARELSQLLNKTKARLPFRRYGNEEERLSRLD